MLAETSGLLDVCKNKGGPGDLHSSTACGETAEDLKGYLDDGVPSGSRFDGPAAALRFVVSSVVGFGLHLDLQLILAKLARQRPVQGWQ